MRFSLVLLPVALLVVVGCGDSYSDPLSGSSGDGANPAGMGLVADPFALESGGGAKPAPPVKPENGNGAEKPPKKVDESAKPPEPEPIVEEAAVGMGKKGDYAVGFVTTPISAYWRTQEKLAFEVQVPHALNLYKAMNGRGPQSHEEFMEKIIKANMIKLPELPEGHEYVYDVKEETLMIRHPAKP